MICINCNKQYRSSVNIPGLYYCVDCDTFIYDNEGPQLEIDLHIVFKAINEITGSEALLFSTRCIALVSDIVAFDVSKKNIFLEMLQAYPNLSSEMIALNCKEMSKKSINDIKKNIKKKTGLSFSKIGYVVDVYAYALGLIKTVKDYNDEINDAIINIKHFESSKKLVQKGDSVELRWEISGPRDMLITLSDGKKKQALVEKGCLTKKIAKKSSYTLTVEGENNIVKKSVQIDIVNKSSWKQWSMALIFILITSITIYSFLQSDEDEKLASEVVESYQETIALPGIYTVKLKNNAIDMSGSFMTAALKYDSINHNYMLLVTSEYQPEMHFFNRLSNDSIYSPTLGGGRVYYKEKLDKTTLIFKNNHLEWIFVK